MNVKDVPAAWKEIKGTRNVCSKAQTSVANSFVSGAFENDSFHVTFARHSASLSQHVEAHIYQVSIIVKIHTCTIWASRSSHGQFVHIAVWCLVECNHYNEQN